MGARPCTARQTEEIPVHLLLIGPDPLLCREWKRAFQGTAEVSVHQVLFEEVVGSFDCLVSPANSFGLMDGGMDLAIIDFFGPELEDRVQKAIWERFRGEQPVGTCLMVPTGNRHCPQLAHCPTMTSPQDVSQTRNAFLACLAALIAASEAGVEVLACPGLGTGTGSLPPEVAARQMRAAWDQWRAPFRHLSWSAARRHEQRTSGRPDSPAGGSRA